MNIDLALDERRALYALASKAAEDELLKAAQAQRSHIPHNGEHSARRAEWLRMIARKLAY